VITDGISEILERRRATRTETCNLIFHNDGNAIIDYRKAWHSACVINGLGRFYCRICRDDKGQHDSVLDAERKCPRCGRKWEVPRYEGRIMHDLRRSAAYELWKSGSSKDDCMAVTGHQTESMFDRYADLFSDAEKQARQRQVQERRRMWRDEQIISAIPQPGAQTN
jgi:integrase